MGKYLYPHLYPLGFDRYIGYPSGLSFYILKTHHNNHFNKYNIMLITDIQRISEMIG
jgi:hypothetical protein